MSQKTFSAYDLLLAAFAPEPEDAAHLLQIQWDKLATFFDLKGSGIIDGERLADEVIDIATRKLQEGTAIIDIRAFLYETAKYVWLNHYRKMKRAHRSLDEYEYQAKLSTLDTQNAELESIKAKCYQRCLRALDAADLELLTEYSLGNTQTRQSLADRNGMSRNSLTVRINRLRASLRKCQAACLKKNG